MLRRLTAAFLVALALGACAAGPASVAADGRIPLDGASVETCFVPGQDCARTIAGVIGEAKGRVWLLGYGFTDSDLARALIEAYRRGVDVRVVLDRSNATARGSVAGEVAGAGVPVFIDRSVRIAHNKTIVVDQGTVVTGSYNWTRSANRANAENIHVLRGSPALAQRNAAYFLSRQAIAEPFGDGRP